MTPIAYLNGQEVDATQAHVSVTDWGFLQGITLSEQLRTFRGEPFEVDAHLDRLFAGMRFLEWDRAFDRDELSGAIRRVVSHNWQLLDPQDDLGVTIFATPGTYPLYEHAVQRIPGAEHSSRATVCVHTYPLPFHAWWQAYECGQHLVPVAIRQVSATSWPLKLKCRSRMHYFLAAKAAKAIAPGAVALLLTEEEHISETPTANVVAYFEEEGLVTPPQSSSLPGISLRYLRQLATQQQLPFVERDLTVAELRQADEMFLTSTPYSMVPVVRFDQQQVKACPGPIYQRLLADWNQHVGVDQAPQAQRNATRCRS